MKQSPKYLLPCLPRLLCAGTSIRTSPTEVYTTSGLPLKRLSLEIAILAMANDLHEISDADSPHICVSYPMKLRVIKYLCLRIFRTGNALTHSNSSKYIPS